MSILIYHLIIKDEFVAKDYFTKYHGRVKCIPIQPYHSPDYRYSENEFIFSYAAAKFQHLLRFE